MTRTVAGVYENGVVRLLEIPEGLRDGEVVVTLVQEIASDARPRGLQYGVYSQGRMSTEEDFKIAEWPGNQEIE
jgi:hypothetical protein